MNNELQKHKNGDKVKWILTFLAFILVGVMLAGIICGWFDKVDVPTQDETPDIVTEENIEIETISSQFMSLNVLSLAENEDETYSENSYSLEATVFPDNAGYQMVDYFIAWANASSTWASDKKVTDYYALAQTSDGSKIAILTCKQPAGEQAIVTVISRNNPQAIATATVDYVKKLIKSTGDVLDGDTSTVKTWTWEPLTSTEDVTGYVWSCNCINANSDEWSVGSKNDYVVSRTITLEASNELKAFLNTLFTDAEDRNIFAQTYVYSGNFSQSGLFAVVGNTIGIFSPCVDTINTGVYAMNAEKFNNLITALKNSSVDLVVTLNVRTEKGSTYSASYEINIADKSLVAAVTSLGINNTEVEF